MRTSLPRFFVALAACLISAVALAQTDPKLVLHYDFDEGSGVIAKDKSGNGLDGKIVGAKYVRRGDGYALAFDGYGCVQIPKSALLDAFGKPGQSYTIEFLFKSPGGDAQSLTEKWPKSNVSYPWAIRGPLPNGQVEFATYDVKTGTSIMATYTDPATKNNQWHHLAAVRDMENGYLWIYVDGLPGRHGRDDLKDKDISNDGQVCLGARNYSTQIDYGAMTGQLDDVRIYARALTAEEAKTRAAMAALPAAATVKDAGPVLQYDFDEGAGAVAKDKSGKGLDGKIIGAKYVRRGDGYALEFDGNSCVQVPKSALLDAFGRPGQSYTIEFRFKSPGSSAQSLTEKWPTSSVPYPWAIRGPLPDGKVECAIYDAKTGGAVLATYTHPAMKDNEWHHLAAVRDTEKSNLWIYVDGMPGRGGYDSLKDIDISNDGQVCIGARSYSTRIDYGGMVGQLDDVRLYARALTAEEVKSHAGMAALPLHRDIESADIVEEFKPVTPVATLRAGAMTVKTGAAGAVQIDAGADSYVVESCFSYPGDDNKIGWNGLPRRFDQPAYPVVEFQGGAETLWKPTVKQVSADTLSVEAQGKYYRLRRTITARNGKVDFEDELTNLATTPTGVVVRHGITADKDFLERFNPGLEVPANPTVFLRGPRRSAALVMNDNVSRHRIRAALGASKNHSGVQIQRFALDAGKSYTFSWSVYVMEEGQGYFDFINRVRNDWNANFTIDGPFTFCYLRPEGDDIKFYLIYGQKSFYVNQVLKDPAELREYMKWRGIRIIEVSPWLDHDPGAMDHVVTWDEYRAIMRKFLPAFRKAAPEVRVLASIETDWISFRREEIKDSDRIPVADRTQPGGPSLVVELEPDVSRLIEDSFPAWKDSWVRDSNGRLMIYTYYRGGKAIEQPPVCVFPEVGNKRYDYLMQQINLAIDELGMDGVYLDEFPLGQNGFRRTYGGPWDGISAEMDFHTGRIYGQYKDCGLAGVQARVNVMNHVFSKGKTFVANRHSTTREEQSMPAYRFTECGHAASESAAACQPGEKPPLSDYMLWTVLNSPIGLGLAQAPAGEDPARWIMRGLIAYLRHGMLFYYGDAGPAEPPMTEAGQGATRCIQEMYPITPVELGEGFIVGKERILSAVSIERPLNKPGEPTVLLFDISGRPADAKGRYEVVTVNGERRIKLTLKDWAEVAIVK